MTSGQKIAFSLLTAMGLFAVFVLSLHSTLFKQLEMKFYTQSKIEENTEQLNKLSQSYDLYIQEILTQIETGENAWCRTPAVRSYYLQNPSESDVSQRRLQTETLFSKIPALNGIRILDKNGKNVHFSTYDNTDILKQTGITKFYKNYPDITKDADEIGFERLAKNFDEKQSAILLDEEHNRIIICVPYFWMDQVYSGQCLFYFNLFDIEKELTAREVLSLGQNFVMYSGYEDFKGGFTVGIPSGKKKEFKVPVEKYWKSKNKENLKFQTPEKLLELEDGRFYVALSATDTDLHITGIYTSDLFELSSEIKVLIYISVFISILLIVFLVFSLARDPEQVLKKRIKKIQYGIIKECIDNEDKVEWSYISRQLKARKKDLTSEILQSLKVHSKKKRKELDEFLEKNWNEIFSIFDDKAAAASSSAGSTGGNGELNGDALAAIRQMLEEVLQTTKLNVSPVVQTVKVPASAVQVQTDDVEEIEEVEEVEEIEEAEDLEDADAVEEIEEVESLDDAEEIEEVEEIPEVEELDEIEEIEEVSEAEEADVAESVDDAEEIEEVEEAEEIEDADAVEEIEEVEEAPEEVEEAETVDEAEEIEEAAEAEVTEEIPDEVEAVEEAEDVEEIEELEELDEVPEPAQHKFNPKLILMNQPVYIYKPGNETYFRSEDFATVENFNAEELELGSHVIIKPEVSNSELLDFQTYPLIEPEVAEEDTFETEDVEELAEAVENPLPYYSMTSFADNLASEMPVLEAASPENPIVENEGVFSISENLDYGEVKQDKNFKALVDSVL